MEKICQSCGNVFYKKVNVSKKNWEKSKYCSSQCSRKETLYLGRVKGLKLGNIPWNKDTTGICKANSGSFQKGRIGNNLGKKFPERSGSNNPRWNSVKKQCLHCGKTIFVEQYRLEIKKWCDIKCYMQWRRGENNPRYKGDRAIVKLRKRIMELAEYSEWHGAVLKRDHYLCQECHMRGDGLEIHHIESVMSILQRLNITTIKQARECKELWDLNNGQTLCRRCHRKTDSYGRQTIKECN